MSIFVDVNAGAPCTSLASLVSTVRESCPKSVVEGGYTWTPSSVSATTRNTLTCIQFGYSRSGGTTSYLWVYYNKTVIGLHDYPELCSVDSWAWIDFASTQGGLLAVLVSWLQLLVGQFGYPNSGMNFALPAIDSNAWLFQCYVHPTPEVAANPGILPYIAGYANKWTDKTANVQTSPTATLNTTTIAASYNVQQPGSAGTFQSDFVTWMQTIADNIAAAVTPTGESDSTGNVAFQVKRCADRLATITTELDQDQGGGAEPNSILAELTAVKHSLEALNTNLSSAIDGASSSESIDLLTQAVEELSTSMGEKLEGIAGKVDDVGAHLVDGTTGENVAEAIAGQDLSVDTSGLETKLDDVKSALLGATSGSSVADAISGKEIPVADVAALNTKLDALSLALLSKLDDLITALPTAASNELSDIDTDLFGIGLAQGSTALAAGTMAADLTAIAALQAGNVPGILAALAGLASIATILTALKTLLDDKTFELGPTTSAMFDNVEGLLERAFITGDGSYVRDIRDSIGWSTETDGNTFDESVRGKLQAQLDNLCLTSADGETTITLADLIANTGFEVRWGDLLFGMP